jgi:lauroyl/myristoyl acyltransferase
MSGLLAGAFSLSLIVPDPLSAHVTRQLARWGSNVFSRRTERMIGNFPRALVAAGGWASPREAFAAQQACYLESLLQVLKCYRPGGYQPQIETVGFERLGTALDSGRGAVLWFPEFVFHYLAAKMALHEAGVRASFLVRPSHPFSGTRAGIRFLNPIQGRIEARYVRERVTIRKDHELMAMRLLQRRLRENGVVCIGAGGPASTVIPTSFLGGCLGVSAGPPRLAQAAGCDILPLLTFRIGPGRFEVRVERPLSLDGSDERRAAESACRQFAELTEVHALRYPDQWCGWQRGWTPGSGVNDVI